MIFTKMIGMYFQNGRQILILARQQLIRTYGLKHLWNWVRKMGETLPGKFNFQISHVSL